MPNTKLLAKGNPVQVDPVQSELAQLDLISYETVRLSVGNWEGSPGPVVIAISQVDQPNTPNANLIASVDSFTLAPDESVSKVYEVPGGVVVFLANPEQPPQTGIQVFFTIYGRAALGHSLVAGPRTAVQPCTVVGERAFRAARTSSGGI